MNEKLKIFNISTDEKITDLKSRTFARVFEYRKISQKYKVVVLSKTSSKFSAENFELVSVKKSFCKMISLANLFLVAKKELKKEKYDVLSVQDPYFIGFVSVILSKICKIGLEVQVHGFEKETFIRKIIARLVFKRADSIRVVSERLKNKLISEFGVLAKKITVVHIFVEAPVFPQKNMKNQDEPFVFLSVGRLVPVKNFEMQIKAFAELMKEKIKAELWIAGEGIEKERLVFLAKKMNVYEKVKFIGWSNNVGELYVKANVFLLTSFAEGWPLVIAEASAGGLPIIMTDVGSANEFIKDGENGLVVPINDVSALKEAMKKIYQNENLRKEFGEKVKNTFANLPSKEKTFSLYEKSWRIAFKE